MAASQLAVLSRFFINLRTERILRRKADFFFPVEAFILWQIKQAILFNFQEMLVRFTEAEAIVF